jgi:hypothetical protein
MGKRCEGADEARGARRRLESRMSLFDSMMMLLAEQKGLA